MTTEETPFERKMRERKAAKASANAAASGTKGQPVAGSTPANAYDADVPTAEELDLGKISPEQMALSEAIEKLDIVEAYNKWCKKMVPKFGANQRESIMISCPNPQHPDRKPSAWANRDKNTYYCSGCSFGGDVWDIAAFHFGFPVPGYKRDPVMFRELREKMGNDLGFVIVQGLTQTHVVAPGTEDPEPEEEKSVGLLPSAASEKAAREEAELAANAPTIDWRSLIQTDSFLDLWMRETTLDDSPEEYHFWTGLMALGFAAGRDLVLEDRRPVVGNLFVCLTGRSGIGKSLAKEHLTDAIREAMGYDSSNPLSRGTKHIRSPGSAEYLIACFESSEEDPVNPKKRIYWPVRGLVDFEELAALMGTAGRSGNNLKPQLMDIYDARKEIGTGSNTGGVRRADFPFGQAVSTTQNRSLRRLLEKGDDGSGFINRWVFAQGKEKPPRSRGGTAIDLTKPITRLKQTHQWTMSGGHVTWSDEASDLWDSFFHGVVVPTMRKADENGTAVLNRMDLLMKKLFLLFSVNRFEKVLSAASVQQALDLWPYLLATYGIVNTEMQKTEGSDLRDEVLAQIVRLTKATSKSPSRREIYSAVKRKVTDDKMLIDIITNLLKLELIHEIPSPPGTRGRPTVRYAISE